MAAGDRHRYARNTLNQLRQKSNSRNMLYLLCVSVRS
jgi:hypothetical protein